MTTVAYRDGVLAADSLAWTGRGSPKAGTKRKLHQLPADHARFPCAVWACSSSCVGADAWAERWLMAGAAGPYEEKERPSDYQLLLVTADQQLYVGRDGPELSGPISSDYFAIGSGEDYAMGAMAMGASAERAVEVAKMFDAHTGGPVCWILARA